MSSEQVSVLQIGRRLLVTIPADPADRFLESVQERILQAFDRRNVHGVVLDISAVQVVDSFFARVIAETGEMVRLMGGRTVVTGLKPAVALTLTELGLSLGRVRTAVDVEAALELLRDAEHEGA